MNGSGSSSPTPTPTPGSVTPTRLSSWIGPIQPSSTATVALSILPPTGDLIITLINDDDPTKTMSGSIVKVEDFLAPHSARTDGTGKAKFSIKPGKYFYYLDDPCFVKTSFNVDVHAASTVTADLHVSAVSTVLAIQSVAFTGNHPVDNDTTGPFPSPEWTAGASTQSPVSYTRNNKVAFTAVFKVTTAPLCAQSVAIKATATFGSTSLEWDATITVNPGDTTASASLTSNNPLANEVGIFETSDIAWQTNPRNKGWQQAGTSRNVLYVTLGDPTVSPNYWTLLDISCRGAAGKSNENDFVTASFVPFTSTIGDGNGFKRKRDGAELTYYKNGAGTPSIDVFTCANLLSRADGTGRCGAWARFLVAMHQVHGVSSSTVFGVTPTGVPMFIVKNCTFNGAGTLPAPFPYRGNVECVKTDGIKGQGKNNPQCTFGDHAIVKHSTGLYDPSYGVGPTVDLPTWKAGGLAGSGQGSLVTFTFAGDPHFLPGACSPNINVTGVSVP